jgi:hypothetical protein
MGGIRPRRFGGPQVLLWSAVNRDGGRLSSREIAERLDATKPAS